jgi:amino acid adenylation domain-containing protein
VLNILHQSNASSLDTPGLTVDRGQSQDPPKTYALVLLCSVDGGSILVKAHFDKLVLAQAQVHRILRQLEHRFKQLIGCPPATPLKSLPCLNFGNTLEITDWNKRSLPEEPGRRCLHDLVTLQADQHPNHLAVDAWDGKATYRELLAMADNLADEILLRKDRIAAEEPVCFILDRSLSLIVAALAVMKIGGTCVPIDPSLPSARKEAILRLCGARLLLTTPEYHEEFRNDCTRHAFVVDRSLRTAVDKPPANLHDSHRAAYMLFTSGSTGQPKSVILEHRSLASSLTSFGKKVGWVTGTRVLQFSSPACDTCVLETIRHLLAGGFVCIPSAQERESGLGDYIKSAEVDFALLTPTSFRNLTPEDVLPTLQTLKAAGEPIPRKVFETWSGKFRLFNSWGPCEVSIMASIAELSPDCRYPDTIGTAAGCSIWIVDPGNVNRLLPVGAVGEMLIDGPGVARGYHNAPELTDAAFIKPPSFASSGRGRDTSSRLYRTGDLARYNADGSIAFCGRRDEQVKIRGQRFELGEVESALMSHQAVGEAIVTIQKAAPDFIGQDPIAILTFSDISSQNGASTSALELELLSLGKNTRRQLDAIQKFAKSNLPSYMVPTVWFPVRRLPVTASGKVDRVNIKAWLSQVDVSAARNSFQARSQPGQNLTAPATPAERTLHLAWSAVLNINPAKIGRESSFVRLGRDSITAMQVATRCRKEGFIVSVAALLRIDTLTECGTEVEIVREAVPTAMPIIGEAEESIFWPLSPIQGFMAANGSPASHNQFNQALLLEVDQSIKNHVSPRISGKLSIK